MSRSPSRGNEKMMTGGLSGSGGSLGASWTLAVGEGAVVSSTLSARMYTTPSTVRARPSTRSHFPVSRRSLGSSFQPFPFGFSPVTHTANTSFLRTQSRDFHLLNDGRSPKRLDPRNCPTTRIGWPSNCPWRVSRSSRVTSGDVSRLSFRSVGPSKDQKVSTPVGVWFMGSLPDAMTPVTSISRPPQDRDAS